MIQLWGFGYNPKTIERTNEAAFSSKHLIIRNQVREKQKKSDLPAEELNHGTPYPILAVKTRNLIPKPCAICSSDGLQLSYSKHLILRTVRCGGRVETSEMLPTTLSINHVSNGVMERSESLTWRRFYFWHSKATERHVLSFYRFLSAMRFRAFTLLLNGCTSIACRTFARHSQIKSLPGASSVCATSLKLPIFPSLSDVLSQGRGFDKHSPLLFCNPA